MSKPETKYDIPEKVLHQINRSFQYHKPKDGQSVRYINLRDQARSFAIAIAENTPPSREQSLALTKLEEAVMFANAAIARNE